MRNLRIGIVGCGKIANSHLAAYKACGNVELAALFDSNREVAENFSESTGARIADSVNDMVDNYELDAVSICTPPAVHYENCLPFIYNGISILCEKPLGANEKDASKLYKTVKKHNAVLMTAFCHRFYPALIEAKKLVSDGVLGRLAHVRIIFTGYKKLAGNHRANFSLSGGGVLIDNGSHAVDIFRFLAADPWRVNAFCANIGQREINVEDFCVFNIESKSGIFCEITSSYSFAVGSNRVEIYGEKGTAIVSYWGESQPNLSYKTNTTGEWKVIDCSNHPDRFIGQAMHFTGCIRKKQSPCVTAYDGFVASKTISAAYKAAKEQKTITVRL